MTYDGGLSPSWDQLLTGAHPSFPVVARTGRALAPRHGRDGWRNGSAHAQRPDADGMGWVDAVSWTVVAAGAALLATRLGDLVR